MFFIASKILGVFTQPLNLLFLFFGLAGILLIFGKLKIARKTLIWVCALFLLCGYTQIADLALSVLERQTDLPATNQFNEKPLGIIVLGGTATSDKQVRTGWYHLNSSAERITEAIILAKKYPSALLVFTGGSGHIVGRKNDEALAFRILFEQMDAVQNEVLLEAQAKNTWQNAVNTIAITNGREIANWLLVTSAFHMPRAIGSFNKAGLDVIAWPTDYRAEVLKFPWLTANSTEQFSKLNILFHELAGIIVYKLSGRM